MQTKKCFKCGQEKPLDMFYKHPKMIDGHVNKCKECNKKDVSENYRKRIDQYKDYDQTRNQKRKEYIKENSKKNKRTKETIFNYSKKWQNVNKLKRASHIILGNGIRDGKIKKGVCQICGTSKNIQAHHYDYTKPLSVIWLCTEHHAKIHWWLKKNERRLRRLKSKFTLHI